MREGWPDNTTKANMHREEMGSSSKSSLANMVPPDEIFPLGHVLHLWLWEDAPGYIHSPRFTSWSSSVIWETQSWGRWLFALSNFVFQRIAQLKARVREEDTAWNKNLRVSSINFFFFSVFFFFRKHLCNSGNLWHLPPSRYLAWGSDGPKHTSHREKPSLCYRTPSVSPGMYPRGILHAELLPWEKFVSPFPGGKERITSTKLSWLSSYGKSLPRIQTQANPCFKSQFSNSYLEPICEDG